MVIVEGDPDLGLLGPWDPLGGCDLHELGQVGRGCPHGIVETPVQTRRLGRPTDHGAGGTTQRRSEPRPPTLSGVGRKGRAGTGGAVQFDDTGDGTRRYLGPSIGGTINQDFLERLGQPILYVEQVLDAAINLRRVLDGAGTHLDNATGHPHHRTHALIRAIHQPDRPQSLGGRTLLGVIGRGPARRPSARRQPVRAADGVELNQIHRDRLGDAMANPLISRFPAKVYERTHDNPRAIAWWCRARGGRLSPADAGGAQPAH